MKLKHSCIGCDRVKQLICKKKKSYKSCAYYNMPKTNLLEEVFKDHVYDIGAIFRQKIDEIILEEMRSKIIKKFKMKPSKCGRRDSMKLIPSKNKETYELPIRYEHDIFTVMGDDSPNPKSVIVRVYEVSELYTSELGVLITKKKIEDIRYLPEKKKK